MTPIMKRFMVASAVAVFLLGGSLSAKEVILKATHHRAITDPEVYIPLREQMTRMEMKFVDIQIMAAEDKIDFKAVQKALDEMENASKKIRAVNPSDTLTEPLQKLTDQIAGLIRNAKGKDRAALKGNLDLLFQTCFKCHQAHAPLM